MGKQMGFIVNLGQCIGCLNCELACLKNHSWGLPFRHLREFYREEGTEIRYVRFSIGCNHCEEPACIKACPYDAPQYNSLLGLVDKCDMCIERLEKGQEPYCVGICPTDAISVVDIKPIREEYLSKSCLGFEEIDLTRPSIRFKERKPQKQVLILKG